MTAKRFGMIKSKFTGMYVPVDNQHVYNFCGFEDGFTCMGFVNALNALQQKGTENGKIATQLLEENEQLKQEINSCLNDLNKLEIAIEKVQNEFKDNQEVQRAIARIIVIKRELKGDD